MAGAEGVHELLEEGGVVVEGVELDAEGPGEVVAAVPVVVASARVPAEGERVDARHRAVRLTELLAGVQQGIRVRVGDDALDSGPGDDLGGPAGVGVAAADLLVEGLPVLARDAAGTELVEVG